MALPLYLAMTAAELFCASELPPYCGYMACHFSPYSTGLSNFPPALPEGSVLILNDRTPAHGHDPDLIAQQLSRCVEEHSTCGILLDFQRPGCSEISKIAQAIVHHAPCPVAVSPDYSQQLSCPVFLPPPPLNCLLRDYIAPWQDRELWLEAALDRRQIILTAQGCSISTDAPEPTTAYPFTDPLLHCHYRIETTQDQAHFLLQRTSDDLNNLLQEAGSLGITKAIGLYQELSPFSNTLT